MIIFDAAMSLIVLVSQNFKFISENITISTTKFMKLFGISRIY